MISSLLDKEKCYVAVKSKHEFRENMRDYFKYIHKDYYSFVKIDPQQITSISVSAIMFTTSLTFSLKETEYSESPHVSAIQLRRATRTFDKGKVGSNATEE
jgi:hypothetical protein